MDLIAGVNLQPDQAVLLPLGQAGYLLHSCGVTVVIDPYLSDSVGADAPEFSRAFPPPIQPGDLKADVFIVTHNHADHLDPETVGPYRHKAVTTFVAPRLAAVKLCALGVPEANIVRVDSGEEVDVRGLRVRGVYAIPNTPEVIDTAGYRIEFPNGRSVYHTADTGFSGLFLKAAPNAEVLLVCINGKWGNLDAMEAARLTAAVGPKVAIPNHYDVMKRNSENPETFAYFARREAPDVRVRILRALEPLVW